MTTRPLLLLALLAALPAFADNTADESDIAFSLGNAHYARREYEPALSQYFLSYRLVPNRNVLFNIARCYESISRFDEAYRYFHDLSVDPTLPAADAQEVKAALARLAPRVALVKVTSTPPGADVFLDREDLGSRGKTPQTVAVSPGTHEVVVKLGGHEPASAKVSVGRGREATAPLSLTPIVGTAALAGTPEGAVVRESAEGPELGRLPARLLLAPGQHLLVVQAQGFLPSQVLVDVKARETTTARVTLTERPRPTGKVIVTANRDGALVRVDGRDSGFTPVVLTLTEGPHELEVTTDEVTPLLQHLEVKADEEQRVTAELRYAPPPVQAASRSALSVDQAPASVTIITREELRAFGYLTVAEALEGVRGFFFTDDRIYTYVGIRGFSPPGDLNTRVLTLYDGHAMNEVWAGQGFSARDLDVDLGEVERLEVVRGPTSLLFGSGAFFGVINVVPRDHLGQGRNVEATAGVGAQGAAKGRVTGSLGQGARTLLVSAAGYRASGAETTDLGDLGLVRGLDGESVYGASARARFDGFTVQAKWNLRHKDAPTAPHGSAVGLAGTRYTDARGHVELKYERQLGALSLAARAAYDGSRYVGSYATGATGATAFLFDGGGADWGSAELRGGYRLFTGNTLSLALEGQGQAAYQQLLGSPTRDPHQRAFVSASLLDEWQVGTRAFLQAGVRADQYFDLTEVALSPRAAAVLKPYAAGVTKLIAGRAFRAPTIYELYYNDGNLTQRAPTVAPRPELITTFEVEHSHDVTPELRVTAGAYYNLIDRLVQLDTEGGAPACGPVGAPQACVVYANTSKQLTALGAEGQLHWQPGRFTLVDASYSWVLLGGPGVADAPAYPAQVASLRALVPLKEGTARLSGQATWQSSRRDAQGTNVGEALLVNLGLSGEYGRLRYFAGARNLLDQQALLPVASEAGVPTVPQYGRSFWLEVGVGY